MCGRAIYTTRCPRSAWAINGATRACATHGLTALVLLMSFAGYHFPPALQNVFRNGRCFDCIHCIRVDAVHEPVLRHPYRRHSTQHRSIHASTDPLGLVPLHGLFTARAPLSFFFIFPCRSLQRFATARFASLCSAFPRKRKFVIRVTHFMLAAESPLTQGSGFAAGCPGPYSTTAAPPSPPGLLALSLSLGRSPRFFLSLSCMKV